MSRRFSLVLAVLVPVALAVAVAVSAADTPTLVGDVGLNDEYVISLKDTSGNPVTHVDVGTYVLVVHDHSKIHNFHLTGPGDATLATTSIDGTGDSTFTVNLTDGVYRYFCDPHSDVMKGSFTVGTGVAPVANYTATVGPRKSISIVDSAGTRLNIVSPGLAVITVRDRTRKDNFHLSGPGVNKTTGVGFRGTVRWRVTLKAGKYVYRSDRTKRLRGTFTVGTTATAYP